MSAEVERYEAIRHRCTMCRRSWSSVTPARAHVADGCYRDPATRTCATCHHYRPAELGGYEDQSGNPQACEARVPIDDLALPDLPKGCAVWEPWELAP